MANEKGMSYGKDMKYDKSMPYRYKKDGKKPSKRQSMRYSGRK